MKKFIPKKKKKTHINELLPVPFFVNLLEINPLLENPPISC